MRNLKRWVSLMLVLVMSLGMIQTSAFAAGGDIAYEGEKNGSITVYSSEAGTNNVGQPVPGVKVRLVDTTGGRYTELGEKVITNASGATWSNLSAGTYMAILTEVPSTHVKYVSEVPLVLKAGVSGGDHAETTFRVVPRGSIVISRVDTQGNIKSGGTYVVTDAKTGGQVTGSPFQAIGGSVTVPSLPEGEYIVKELNPPAGESLISVAQHVFVRGDTAVPCIFTVANWAHVSVLLLDQVTGAPIPNANFTVAKVGSGVVYTGKTDANGMFTSKALEAGEYVVSQVAPPPSGYQAKYPTQTFNIKIDGENQIFTMYNIPLGSVTVVAYDTITGQPIPQATVTLRNDKNELVGTKTTGPSGEAIFEGLEDGNYTATIIGPDGHVINETVISTTVEGGSKKFVTTTGTEKGSLLVRCIDEEGKPLSGAMFKVTRMNGDYVCDLTTGADGTATKGNLESGSYQIEQTKVAPGGYVLDTKTQTTFVSPGKKVEVEFINRMKPFIVVETMVKGTRMPIPGSLVTLTNSNGQEVRRGYTDSNGEVKFLELEPGTYTAKYTSCPDGYTIEVASQTIVVERFKSGYACLTATKHSAILIEKLDAQTSEPLSGAIFQVRNEQGVPVGLIETDKSGFASTEVLTPGQYTIRELYAPNKYAPTTEIRKVTVKNNEPRHEVFTNTKFSGIVIYAYDKLGNPLANVPYIVYQLDKQGVSTEVAHVVTNNSGIAQTQELKPGRYMITETTIPENYTLVNPTETHVELFAGESQHVRFVHVPKSCILIQTADKVTGAFIPGAMYQITCADSSFTANYVADANGEVQTELLDQGTYYVKQISVPEGYILNTTTQTIQVLRDQVNQAKFFNTPISRIVIQSVIAGSNFGLEECSYTVEDANGKEVFHATTDETGLLTTGELAPGRYTVKEIAVKDGYTIVQSSRTVDVTTGIATSVKFEHIAYTSIIISLTDFEDSTKGLQNSKFIIETLGGEYVTDVVTDSAGRAETEILPAGTYIIRQETAPEGYQIEKTYQWMNLTSNSCARVEFTNKKISGLVIQSFMLNSHTPVPGTQFEISHENGKLVKTVTADSTGVIDVSGLEPDTYVIKEIGTPAGYTAQTLTQKVTITFGASSTVTFYHTGKSSLVISLTDAQTKEPLVGGIFRVMNSEGDVVLNDAATDKDGLITLPIMAAGRYTVVQVKAPDGYSIDKSPVTVDVKDEQTAYANVTNHKNKGLTIEVLDSEGGHLDGASFEIRNEDNVVVKTVAVDASGVIFLENLTAGKYTIKETIVPQGWTAVTLTQTVNVTVNDNATVQFRHTNKSSLIINLTDAQTKAPIAGGVFKIVDSKGNLVKDGLVTDEAGKITVPSLPAGRYEVTQVSTVNGYSLAKASLTVDVKDNQTAVLDFVNTKNQSLVIEVLGSDDATHLDGAAFEIRNSNNVVVKTVVSDKTGVIVIDNLAAGKYVIKETTVPQGWTARTLTQEITITVTDNLNVKFYHTQKSSLVITLRDTLSKAPIAGGEFKIEDDKGNLIQSGLITDEAGVITLSSMTAGKYVITQTRTLNGYVIDQAKQTVEIRDNQTANVDFTNHRMTNLTIQVLDESDKFLSGGTFEIKDVVTGIVVGTYTADATGSINVESLAPGKYVIKEVTAPEGWTARTLTQNVTITADKSEIVKFYHTQKSNLTVTVKDKTSGEFVADVEFRITDKNGEFVGDYKTGSNGQFIVASLNAGIYTVTMTKVPDGYELDNEPHKIEIKDNKTILLDLTVKAVSNFRLVNTVKQTGAPIGGVTYKVTTYDGTLVGNYTTNDAGLINLQLKSGTYTFYQISVPEGYVKNETVWNVEIKAGKDQVLEVTNEVESRIIVKFVDAANNNPIAGVKVEIKDDKNNYIGVFKTDDTGALSLQDVLSAGKYKLTIVECPTAYNKDTTVRTVEIKTGETTEVIWKLTSHQGQITIVTLAGEQSAMMQLGQNAKLPGAVYVIKDITGKIVAQISGDANGEAHSGALPLGTYTIQMVTPPTGYQLNSAVSTIVITNASDNKLVQVYCKAAHYNMTVSVTGQMTGWSGSMMKYAFYNIQNQSSVAMNNFYVSMKVPTDCMRAITLYTGSWNYQTYMNVMYKTNQNDWRTLASGVNSKSNISFDLSTQSLGLNTNEYVTDVRLVFPQVIKGFKNTMAPTLYTQVLSGIRTGYQATMRAEVGGQLAYAGVVNGNENLAGGSWCTGQGQFTSYIYGYTNVLPGTLPKTGY